MKERQIGTTELRQRLTDVIQAVKEEKVAYVVETFGRPQVAIVDLNEYERFLEHHTAREEFFDWLETTATENAERNSNLSESELLALIEAARSEVAQEDNGS